MNRTWITLIIIAVITLLGVASYEIFNSIAGENIVFVKHITNLEINSDLGQKQLDFVDSQKSKILVDNASLTKPIPTLEVSVTPTP